MSKKLSEMSLEELWQLFPIFLTEHQACWKEWYEEEAASLRAVLPLDKVKRISHIGSTAVETIWAKPIVDILVEISMDCDIQSTKELLCSNGWICMSQNGNRISFNKGYTEHGFAKQVYHLHLRYEGDNSELYFRDYLIAYPEAAKAYEKLKLDLWKEFEHNRDGYTEAKTGFVSEYTRQAKQKYGARYDVLEKREFPFWKKHDIIDT